jgi:hypothetical protein
MTSLRFGDANLAIVSKREVRSYADGRPTRFSLARAGGVRAFPRFCLSTKAAPSSDRLDSELTSTSDD